jgi:hypothetical protein
MIRIKSKKAGFRRCGIAHPAEWMEYPEGKFTEQEISLLKAEPMLLVEDIEEEKNPDPNLPDDENGKDRVKTGKKGKTS